MHMQLASIGDSLHRSGDAQLHILYPHVIGATGGGDSLLLRQSFCSYLKDCTSAAGDSHGREYADQGECALNAQPPALTYMGSTIWKSQQVWNASALFVDHYVLSRRTGKNILIDEINWWPLVFPIKCRNILPEEAKLAGTDGSLPEQLCNVGNRYRRRGTVRLLPVVLYGHGYNSRARTQEGRCLEPQAGNRPNGWGFSDALLSVGPMHKLLIEGIRQVMMKSVAASGDQAKALSAGAGSIGATDIEYMVISHSLGSFRVFSALNSQNGSTDAPAGDAANRSKIFG
jgi:hypothetical protein